MAKLKTGSTIDNQTIWHAGNDGAGSTLDADLLDGKHGAAYLEKAGGTMTGFLVLHSDPTQGMHPTTKQYVDAGRLGLAVHEKCRVASTANVNITAGGLLVIDGVQTVTGDRVLLKDQTNNTQNGIYVANAGAWNRAADANTPGTLPPGTYTYVEEGTIQHDTSWSLNITGNPTLGETPLPFNFFARVETVSASSGVVKNGVDFSIQDGGVTDVKIGNRTVDPELAPVGDTAALTTILSNLTNRIKGITGATTWRSTPAATIAVLYANKLETSEVTTTVSANKVLRLNSSGLLPASITGNAATATNVDWTGIQNKPTNIAPTTHAATHKTAGSDPMAPSDIGAVPMTDVVTSAAANKLLRLDANAKLPASITGNAETVTSISWGKIIDPPSNYTPASHKATHYTGGSDQLTAANIGAVDATEVVTTAAANKLLKLNGSSQLVADVVGNASTATSAAAAPWAGITGKPSTFTPTAHASTHGAGQADVITPAAINAVPTSDVVTIAAANKILKLDANGELPTSITGLANPRGHQLSHQAGQADALSPASIGAATTSHDHTTGAQIPTTGIVDGAVTDVKLGNRTVVDSTVPSGNTGTLVTLLSNIANRIKVISGTSAWSDSPVTSLATLSTGKLNVAGDTMTGALVLSMTADNKLVLKSGDIDNKSYIVAQNSAGTELSKLGFDGTVWSIGIDKIWHAGNDGTGSTLDSDMVDGYHANSFLFTTETSTSAAPNKLLYLNASSKLPASITGDADTVDGLHAADFVTAVESDARVTHKPVFFVGNEDWSALIYNDVAACTYSTSDSGMLITGAAKNVKIRSRLPVDADGSYYARIKATKKSGTSNFSIGAVTLAANYSEFNGDTAGLYNLFVCANQALTAGNSLTFEGVISGYNLVAGTDAAKFDPGTRYVDLVVQANIAGAGTDVLVINSIEFTRIPNYTANPALVPTTSAGNAMALFGGLMNRIKAVSGETNWYDTPAVTLKNKLSLAGGTMTGAIVLSGAPTLDLHPATKLYTDSAFSTHVAATGAHAATKISNTPAGTIAATDVQSAINELDGDVNARLPLSGGTMTGNIVLKGDPTLPLHPSTKQYVDNIAQGLSPKESCRAATTGANIVLSGTQVLDAVSLVVGDRVLVKDQIDSTQNGVYIVADGEWTRALDFDSDADVSPSSYMFVEEGSVNYNSGWTLGTDGPIVVGVTGLAFLRFSGAGMIQVGTGLYKNADMLSLATGVCTPGTYKSMTVDTYGRVTAGTNPTTLAGFGITDAVAKAGDTMTGFLTLSAAPTAAMHAATKKYVDDTAFIYAAMMG